MNHSIEALPLGTTLGHQLIDTVVANAGSHPRVADPRGELVQLQDHLVNLRSLEISDERLASTLNQNLAAEAARAQKVRLAVHTYHLQVRGHVLMPITNEDDIPAHQWQPIHPSQQSLFADAIEKVTQTLSADPEYQTTPEATVLPPELVDEIVDETRAPIETLAKGVGGLVAERRCSLRSGSRLRRATRFTLGAVYPPLKNDLADWTNPTVQKLTRKTGKLNTELNSLRLDPEAHMARRWIGSQQAALSEVAINELDTKVADINQELMAAHQLKTTATKTKSKDTGYGQTETRQPLEAAKPKSSPPSPEQVQEGSETIREIGAFSVSQPWLDPDQPELTAVSELTTAEGGRVYIARSLSKKLRPVADASRAKAEMMADGVNEYDELARRQARKIAGGTMPYQNTNGTRRMHRNSGPYDGMPIYYGMGTGSNVSRLYFTTKKVGELLGDQAVESLFPDPEAQCVVVLAETDKKNQVGVLQTFTGARRKRVRTSGIV